MSGEKHTERRGLNALVRYVEMRQAMPLKGLGDSVHHIHASTEFEAELRLSDLVEAVNALPALLAALEEMCCEGCPPIGYPTDETRCKACPKRVDGTLAAYRSKQI